jgi:hypothetical protein
MVLAPFDPSLQAAAIEALNRRISIQDREVAEMLPPQFKLTELLLESGVKEIKEDVVCLKDGREIPYGVAVWAAGNGPLPITLNIITALGEGEQVSLFWPESDIEKKYLLYANTFSYFHMHRPMLKLLHGEGLLLIHGYVR